MDVEKKPNYSVDVDAYGSDSKEERRPSLVELAQEGQVDNVDGLHRKLTNRQIQWIAVGGSIGTALFVSIGWGLLEGGPGSLFLGFAFYSMLVGMINNSMAEMTVYMPISGSFIRFAHEWVDPAFGFMAGWNFFLYEAILIPFEISALNLVLNFWRDDIPVAAVVAVCIVLYAIINVFAVRWFGEAEFWLASGKVLLIIIVFFFTFITMVGGNPKHDAYGFRYWNNPGAFAEYIATGSLGRFQGFLGAFFTAAWTVVGPEYIAMVAGEAVYPRKTIKQAFKTVYWRFAIFFVGGAFCIGIVLPYNDPKLVNILGGGTTSGAASPYIIAMQNLGITGLPHLVNALLVTSIFSAGNSYVYMASRSLYGLALDGQAPKICAKTTRSGIPWVAFVVTMLFPFLAFLSVGSGTSQVIHWLINLVTASQIMNYVVMGITYGFFYRACKVQGIDRKTLPYYGYFQPYLNWVGVALMFATMMTQGYTIFLPGNWDVGSFFTYYTMVFFCVVAFVFWKVVKQTKFVKPEDADLVWDKPVIDAYEAATEPPLGIWTDSAHQIAQGLRKVKLIK